MSQIEWLINIRNLLLTVTDAEKSKIKVPVGSYSGEGPFPGPKLKTSCCIRNGGSTFSTHPHQGPFVLTCREETFIRYYSNSLGQLPWA